MVVMAILAGGWLFSLSAQHRQAFDKESGQQLDTAIQALLGFALSEGRLPCPADGTLTAPNPAGGEALTCPAPDQCTCTHEHGVLPWRTLGVRETDPWGSRISYFVGREFANPLTATERNEGRRARFSLDTPGRAVIFGESGVETADQIPAVIIIHGGRAGGAFQPSGVRLAASNSADEAENTDQDLRFVARPATDDFDDHLAWIIPGILKSRLVETGRLP